MSDWETSLFAIFFWAIFIGVMVVWSRKKHDKSCRPVDIWRDLWS